MFSDHPTETPSHMLEKFSKVMRCSLSSPKQEAQCTASADDEKAVHRYISHRRHATGAQPTLQFVYAPRTASLINSRPGIATSLQHTFTELMNIS